MHSKSKVCDHQGSFQVQVLPALGDNFMYLLIDNSTKQAAAIDPVDAKSMQDAVQQAGCQLTHVLTTHHHSDHSGGNEEMAQSNSKLVFIGGDKRIPALTQNVDDGHEFPVGNLQVRCLHTPCHTSGHVCYYVTAKNNGNNVEPAVFTGDTLFVAGCGKFFEGTPQEMHASMAKLAKLPDNTSVYVGHEYTETNLKFAKSIEPDNKLVQEQLERVTKLREDKQPTVPSKLEQEKKWNVFLKAKTAEKLGELRTAKDNFKA